MCVTDGQALFGSSIGSVVCECVVRDFPRNSLGVVVWGLL